MTVAGKSVTVHQLIHSDRVFLYVFHDGSEFINCLKSERPAVTLKLKRRARGHKITKRNFLWDTTRSNVNSTYFIGFTEDSIDAFVQYTL